jgi:divalent metal cation (Fe/Co/Zn/Cd) transporter
MIQSASKKEKILSDVHNVRVRETAGGLFVHYHSRFPQDTPVSKVHDVIDRIEDGLKAANLGILRVIAHAEPIGEMAHDL